MGMGSQHEGAMNRPITCTRRIQFCAGHRLLGHESKCSHLHGHNYVALFHARAEELDGVGRVVDFSVLKERLGGWVDEHWDHGFIFNALDVVTRDLLQQANADLPLGQKSYQLPVNPTAENMADHLLRVVAPAVMLNTGVEVYKVTLWETENCCAEVEL